MTAPELKPCPFCGEGKTASTYFDHEQGDKWGYASCDACGARGPEVRTEYDRNDNAPWRGKAIAAWNTRADHADTATWNAAIRAAAAKCGKLAYDKNLDGEWDKMEAAADLRDAILALLKEEATDG